MLVARLHGVGELRLSREPVPVAGPGSSLVKVSAVGICGSDLHWWGEAAIGDAVLEHPLVLGHEGAGVIEDGPRRGERVAIDPAIPCGTCRSCLDGYRNLCTAIVFAGHGGQDGLMREFMTWPSARLHRLPDRLSDAEGAVLEPLGVAIHALDLGHLRIGGTAAVVGCGPIGLLLVQLLRSAGAVPVLAVDPLAHRRDAASRYGAGATVDPAAPEARRRWASWPLVALTRRSRSREPTRRSSSRWRLPAREDGWCWPASPATTRPDSARRSPGARA